MYSLWIGGKRVYNLNQLKENFDLESVELYCCGGGLARWLRQCGENETADKVEKLNTSFDLSEQLAEIFGQPKPAKTELANLTSVLDVPEKNKDFAASFTAKALQSESGSFMPGEKTDTFNSGLSLPSSYEISSFGVSSFETSSVYTGSSAAFSTSFSLNFSSFSLETTLFSLSSFNFTSTSFMTSSFHEFEYEYETGGSFSILSGSFALGSFKAYADSFTDTSFIHTVSSFNPELHSDGRVASDKSENGSFDGENADGDANTTQLSPSEKILQNIIACPLNRFGYGLHLI